jgi:hypothetical protein
MNRFSLGDICTSKVNVRFGVPYKIVKLNKTTCWVETTEPCNYIDKKGHKHFYTNKLSLYKNVPYSILNKVGGNNEQNS